MIDKQYFISQYQKLKELDNGNIPGRDDFLKFCKIDRRKLEKVFGGNAYTKLQKECGDASNKFQFFPSERTTMKQILDQYGQLIRKREKLPVAADWEQEDLKPTIGGLSKVHNLKWSTLPATFIKEYYNKSEWRDVIEIIRKSTDSVPSDKPNTNRIFNNIVEKIENWKPDRKRIIEEGYKIELRNYLNEYFNIEEEVGESNVDLLINKKYPIEVKKDPSQAEYDRLLGQMIRHNNLYGSAIAVVTSVSSGDRFKKFQKLFIEVHNKLGMTAEIILK